MADYCEMCDLPLSTCVHGRPPPSPPPTPSRATGSSRATRSAAPRAKTPRAAAGPPVRRAPRRFTAPDELQPHILAVLEDAGGELEAETFFAHLEERLGDTLLEGDRQRTPEGELRWRYAARRARQALLADGRLGRGAPGVWTLP